MRVVLIFASLCGVLLAEERKYTTKYDDVDVDSVINSDRLLNGYVKCLLKEGPCTPDAAELRKNLPDALATDCTACSEAQKNAANKISQHLIDAKPEQWKRLEEVYDPSGIYRIQYLANKSKTESTD
ncbi:ejaculatory bulb-specific protein 3-like [Orussus abietinus]|uniref:ejaculatory bulb-specific protein 3-like n=1 Tax=Orussus abietinus TaxID=222816 RepID=UPI000626572E|nr:ejaculatory bulb-specific protein 3-like [Orussus abietinus]